MPSNAANSYIKAKERAGALAELVRDARLRPISDAQRQIFLHAALASHVAGWESYIEKVIADFFVEISDPLNPKYSSLHRVFQARFDVEVRNFNTPNWDKSRRLLVDFTGYDPINDWTWSARGMTWPLLQARLNEILKIRHSFAHGVSMPAFPWNTSSTGKVRLTFRILSDVGACFQNLVSKTDQGLSRYMQSDFGIVAGW